MDESESRFVIALQDRARDRGHQSRVAVIDWLTNAGTIILGKAGVASQWRPSVHTDPLEAQDDPWGYAVAMCFVEKNTLM